LIFHFWSILFLLNPIPVRSIRFLFDLQFQSR
jgi:hypothetical protein